MKLFFGTITTILMSFSAFTQEQFSYSFSGAIDSSFVKQLEKESMEVEGVTAAKARYKVDKEMGEIIIYTELNEDKKDPYSFSPVQIKAIIQRYELIPGQLIKLKTTK